MSVVRELRGYLVGWKGYFQLADTPRVFSDLDEWIRHRLRAIHLKQWKRGRTVYRELVARGMSSKRDHRGEHPPLVVELEQGDQRRLPDLLLRRPRPAEARCDLNSLNRRMRTRTSGGVGGNGWGFPGRPYPIVRTIAANDARASLEPLAPFAPSCLRAFLPSRLTSSSSGGRREVETHDRNDGGPGLPVRRVKRERVARQAPCAGARVGEKCGMHGVASHFKSGPPRRSRGGVSRRGPRTQRSATRVAWQRRASREDPLRLRRSRSRAGGAAGVPRYGLPGRGWS